MYIYIYLPYSGQLGGVGRGFLKFGLRPVLGHTRPPQNTHDAAIYQPSRTQKDVKKGKQSPMTTARVMMRHHLKPFCKNDLIGHQFFIIAFDRFMHQSTTRTRGYLFAYNLLCIPLPSWHSNLKFKNKKTTSANPRLNDLIKRNKWAIGPHFPPTPSTSMIR